MVMDSDQVAAKSADAARATGPASAMTPVELKFECADAVPGIYLVNQDNKHAMSAVAKVCENFHPGSIILLTEQEIDALNDPQEFRKFP